MHMKVYQSSELEEAVYKYMEHRSLNLNMHGPESLDAANKLVKDFGIISIVSTGWPWRFRK